MRLVFTDEAGLSRHEPFVVVAGVFVDADNHLIPLERELERLIWKHIPAADHRDFVFHATDIWSGKRFFKDREKWPLDRRILILRDLARVPKKIGTYVAYEAVERTKFDLSQEAARAGRPATPHEASVGAHAVAFCACMLRIEQQMRGLWPNEIAQIVAEDNHQVRILVQGAHELFRAPSNATREARLVPNNILPLQSIRGSVHFASKSEFKPLQLADLCAFVIRGHLTRHPHITHLYDRIKPMMLTIPKDDLYRGPALTATPPYVPGTWQAIRSGSAARSSITLEAVIARRQAIPHKD